MNEEHFAREPPTEQQDNNPDYDMIDNSDDLEQWRHLRFILDDCQKTIVTAYRTADSNAKSYQLAHKVVIFVATLCGMLAVILAILQLSSLNPLHTSGVRVAETLAVIVAGIAVVLGLYAAFPSNWLLEREKANRCRSLKFRFLLNPQLWSGKSSEERKKWLEDQIESLKTLDRTHLKHWAERRDEVAEATLANVAHDVNAATLNDLIAYFRRKRLIWQQGYFNNQANGRYFWDKVTRFAPPLLFFLSILAALGHFGYELLAPLLSEVIPTLTKENMVSLGLIVLGACFPVVGAGFRTLRMANEFGRNTLRFSAVSNRLNQLSHDLQKRPDLRAKHEILRDVEKTLEDERREWMRLMFEAEWFG